MWDNRSTPEVVETQPGPNHHCLSNQERRLAMNPTRTDDAIRLALAERPNWIAERVYPRLDGYPSPERCWVWTGAVNSAGYGQVGIPRHLTAEATIIAYVHRVAWMAARGDIDSGLVLDHDGPNGCSVTRCANPDHLQMVTRQHNTVVTGRSLARDEAGRTHCPKGHPLKRGNLVLAAEGRGKRNCRTCQAESTQRRDRAVSEARLALGLTHKQYVAAHGKSEAEATRVVAGLESERREGA